MERFGNLIITFSVVYGIMRGPGLFHPAHVYARKNLPLPWPLLDKRRGVSGTLGEFRSRYFHQGIDFPTYGETGIPVVAVNDGYISRIMYGRYSIGYALWITHPDGTVTKYGHLESFHPDVLRPRFMSRIRRKITRRENFNYYLPAHKISFRRGQVIGYSGESGIGPPHLHLEFIKGDTKLDILPRLDYVDDRPPVMTAVTFKPLDRRSRVNGKYGAHTIQLVLAPGMPQQSHGLWKSVYRTKESESPVSVSGRIGVLLTCYDSTPHGSRLGIVYGRLRINGKEYYRFSLSSIGPSRRFDNYFLYDIDHSRIGRGTIYRYYFYRRRYSRLPFTRSYRSGVINTGALAGQGAIRLTVDIMDSKYNLSSVQIGLGIDARTYKDAGIKPNSFSNKENAFSSKDGKFRIAIPRYSLIDDQAFRLTTWNESPRMPRGLVLQSRIYCLSPYYREFRRPLTGRLKYPRTDRTFVFFKPTGANGLKALLGRHRVLWPSVVRTTPKEDGYHFTVYRTGCFMLVSDRSRPIWRKSSIKNNHRYRRNTLKIFLYPGDIGSGLNINTLRVWVDNVRCLTDHQFEKGRFEVFFPRSIYKVGHHRLRAAISDYAGNRAKPLTIRYTVY